MRRSQLNDRKGSRHDDTRTDLKVRYRKSEARSCQSAIGPKMLPGGNAPHVGQRGKFCHGPEADIADDQLQVVVAPIHDEVLVIVFQLNDTLAELAENGIVTRLPAIGELFWNPMMIAVLSFDLAVAMSATLRAMG